MIARIGIAEVGREIEVAVDGRDEFVAMIEKAYSDGVAVVWLMDAKGVEVGVPTARIGYIELHSDSGQAVGFSR